MQWQSLSLYIIERLKGFDWPNGRFETGMNGVVVKSKDIPSLTAYMRAGVARKPPDLLWQEWAFGKARPKVCP